MRRHLFLAGFLLSAAVLLGALAWIALQALHLESREREARQRAAFEERVRLALWRMDTAAAGLLAQQSARPVEPARSPVSRTPSAPPPVSRAPARDPVVREMATQRQLNQAEFDQRVLQNQVFGPRAATPRAAAALLPSPVRPAPAAAPRRLDGPATREWLAAQVRDLLPRAVLLPVAPGETADPGRRLALLPLRLDAGPLPAAPVGGGSPVWLGLAVAAAAVLLSIAGAGWQLAASRRLARRRADFVSAVTHELRTPLTTFRLYTEMLSGEMVPAAERPAYLGTLRDEADRLGHLVENVLAFSRLERVSRRSRHSAVETVALGPLVAETAGQLGPQAARGGLTLVVEPEDAAAAASVRVDRMAVGRILQNLADNACKYGRNPADPRLHLAVQLRDGQAVITLRDHGPGLAGTRRRRLFQPFHRSAEQAAGEAPGVGLGLALSRRLARDFGGDLRAVDPAGGPGAAFELSLPLAL